MWAAVVLIGCLVVSSAFADSTGSVQTKESRIVSGWEASERQFPYMLYVRGVTQFGDVGFCGGSIIHPRWGLSSGKCTANRAFLIITGGMVDRTRPRFFLETRTVFTAPEFIDEIYPITQAHDIAVIGFEIDLPFDEYISAIRLQPSAHRSRDYTGVLMTTSGWGATWSLGPNTEILNWVHLTGVSNFVCLLLHNSNWLVRETTICAGPYNDTSQGICSGDSGVPLVTLEADGVLTQVGIGSFAHSWGCHVGLPGGFTRPGFYHDFIREVTGIDFDWVPPFMNSDADVKVVDNDNMEQVNFSPRI